jgi:hypothetical protein
VIGWDVGHGLAAEVLEAGKSMEFPFSLLSSGRMRLIMNYWPGSLGDLNCKTPPKHAKTVTSPVFTIEQAS